MKHLKTRYWYWIWKTFLGPSRLRKKFVRTFLLSTLLPFVLMGLVSIYLVNKVHRADVAAIEENSAFQIGQSISKVIDDTTAALQINVAYEEFSPIKFDKQPFILETILGAHQSIEELSFICTTPLLCKNGEETTGLTKNKGLNITRENRAKSPEFITASAGTFYTGPIETNQGVPQITLASPVLNQINKVVGVLRADFRFDQIQTIIETGKLGQKGYLYLVDEKGIVIAHPIKTNVGKDVHEIPAVQAILARNTAPAPQEKGTARNFIYQNLAGESVSGAGSLIPKLKWGVVAEWPRGETESSILVITLQIVGFALIAIILIIIMASRTAFKLITPIAYLNQSANIIGSGNFNYRVNIKTGDELEDLGHNINTMAGHLKGLEELHEVKLQAKYLSESLKKEQEFSKLKDQFITTVSHQFNTPLTVINWTLEELHRSGTDLKTMKEGLARIAQSRQDILNIASDLITLSEIGFRYQMKKWEALNLQEMVAHVVATFKPSLEAKKITIPPLRTEGEVIISGNKFAITKVIENLIDNAITYSHEGGVIEIALEGDATETTFSIRDQGIGIPEADKKSIFQEFFRAKNAVQKKNVGTGLGLFLVKTIVEGHGGKIWMTSEQGRGSTFSVSLPRA